MCSETTGIAMTPPPSAESCRQKFMGRFQIILVKPQGYLHMDRDQAVAEILQLGLRTLGHSADIQENLFEAGTTNIFLGVSRLGPKEWVIIPPGSVVYNLESLDDPDLPQHYCDLARQYVLWDYSLQNLEKWKTMQCIYALVHVPLPLVPESGQTLNWSGSEAQRQETTETVRRALQASEGPIVIEANYLAQPNGMAAAGGAALAPPCSRTMPALPTMSVVSDAFGNRTGL